MRSGLIYLCLLITFISDPALGQSYADSLFEKGQFHFAAYEFEKEYFESRSDSARNVLLLKKSLCYKSEGDLLSCLKNLNRINLQNENEEFRFRVYYEKTLSDYLLGNFTAARNELLQMEHDIRDSALKNNSLLLQALNWCELENFEESESALRKMIRVNKLEEKSDSVLIVFRKTKLKSERKAKLLSFLLPGFGQLYAQKSGRAGASLILTTVAGLYFVSSVITGYYATALLTGANMTLRFYKGGADHSVKLVKQYNQAQKQKLKKSILNFSSGNL